MAKIAGLVAALMALALLGWFLLGPGETRGTRETAAGPGTHVALVPDSAPLERADRPPAAVRESAVTPAGSEAGVESSAAEALQGAPGLEVDVRDEGGTVLAGLEVYVEFQPGEGQARVRHSARTDEAGRARFLALRPLDASPAPGLLRVALAGLFVPEVALECPADPWPTQPLELVAPQAGGVELAVREANGMPHVAANRTVVLRLERELAPGAMVWRESATLSAALVEGVARFAHVGLGLRLTAHLSGPGEREAVPTTLDGPRAPGELVRAELVLAAPPPRVVLRVLAPERTPLASAEVQVMTVRRMGGGSLADGGPMKTDAEGRLTLPLLVASGETLTLVLTHRPSEGPECRASLELPRELAADLHDLGDVVLAARAVLVSGRVVDEEGRAVPAASLSLENRSEYDGTVRWDTFAWCEVREDGRFAAYDEAPEEPLRLVFEAPEFQPVEPLEFTPGTTGLELVLRRGHALRGRVRVPAGMSPLAIGVAAQGPRASDRREVGVQASGEFALAGLAPGTCDVEFTLRPTGERVHVVPGVRVAAGESDPRLADVDLTRFVRLVRLGVRAVGGPAAGGWVRVLRAEPAAQVAFVIEAGVAELLLPAAGADVEVNVPGHRLLEVPGLVADREVTLEASFRVQLELAPHVALPSGGSLQLRLVPAQAGDGFHCSLYRAHEQAGWFSPAFGNDENSFDARRVVEVEVQAPGEHEVVFHLVRGKANGSRLSVSLQAGGANTRLVLDESSAGRTFQVEPEAEDYARQLGGQ